LDGVQPLSHTPRYPSPPRDKIVPCDADAVCVKAPCSECLQEIEPLPALTVDQQDYVYHFCSAECLEKWRARKRALQGPGSD
jgi:hypothetical protein